MKEEVLETGEKVIDEETKVGSIGAAENRGAKTNELLREYFKQERSRRRIPKEGECD